MVAIKTTAKRNKIGECKFTFGCAKLIIELFIFLHLTMFRTSHRPRCPFYEHRDKKRFFLDRVRFMEIRFDQISNLSFVWSLAITIRFEILRCNQGCRREKRSVSFSIDLASANAYRIHTVGNYILRYNLTNDAMESNIWLTRASIIRPDKSITNSTRVRPRLKHRWIIASYHELLRHTNQYKYSSTDFSFSQQNSLAWS